MSVSRLRASHASSDSAVGLIIGSGGDLTLFSAMVRAVQMTSDQVRDNEPVPGDWLWLESIDDAVKFAASHRIKEAVADSTLCATGLVLTDRRNRRVPLSNVYAHIERLLGRSSLHDRDSLEAYKEEGASFGLVAKRLTDIVFGVVLLLVGLPVLLPILLVTWIRHAPCNLIRTRTVLGRHGQHIAVHEVFVTPKGDDAPEPADQTPTDINVLLAKLHLRAFPTLLKVISGPISLVGPRAVDDSTMAQGVNDLQAFPERFRAKPGLISLARVRFPYSDSPRDLRLALEYDLYYIRNWSFSMDMRILIRAVLILISDVVKTLVFGLRRIVSMAASLTSTGLGDNVLRHSRIASVPMPTDALDTPLEMKPTLIVGAGQGGRLMDAELQKNHDAGLWPVAFVDDNPAYLGRRIRNIPVLGTTDSIPAVVEREHIETIILAMPSAAEVDLQRIGDIARSTGRQVLTMPSIGNILRGVEATTLRPISTSDLLGRPVVDTASERSRVFMQGKRVMVTGAAGSIGREVVRRAMKLNPSVIYGLDINESDLYDLQQEFRGKDLGTVFVPVIASVVQEDRIDKIMADLRPQIVIHAAAYKHVPLMEDFPHEAIKTNIHGAHVMATASARHQVERFIMVSTDKAVRPTSVMGATKRIAELVVRDVALKQGLSACAVRFGNVLGSRGSVIPLFESQIRNGGPVTVTDKRMTRYFMTIPEAAGLIIEAGAFGDSGVIYMLDMGEPVRIVDVADRLIRLHGKRPKIDIEIAFTGLRPGEKLFEELSLDFEAARETDHKKIRILSERAPSHRISADLMTRRLLNRIDSDDPVTLRTIVMATVEEADGIVLSITGAPTARIASA